MDDSGHLLDIPGRWLIPEGKEDGYIYPIFFDSKWIGDSSPEIQWQTSTGAPPEASPHPTDGTPELKPSDGKSD